MRLCLITGTWPGTRCGVGDYTACLAEALAAQGESVTVLTTKNHQKDDSGDWGRQPPTRIGREAGALSDSARGTCGSLGSSARSGGVCALPGVTVEPRIRSWRASGLPALAAAVRRARPEVAHVQYPTAAYGRGAAPVWLFAWLRLVRQRTACVVTLHEYAQYSIWGRLRLWPLVAAAHTVICTNHRDRRCLRRAWFGRRTGVRVIPLGSNVGPFAARPPAASPGKWMIFGTVMPNKGWETLLPALARLRDAGRDARLTVIGALEPERYAYHRKVAGLLRGYGLSDSVRFTGYLPREQAGAALSEGGGLVVMPYAGGASLNRGSFIAALAHGLAVLTTRPAAPLEGLRHGREYWGVRAGDPEELAAGMIRLQDDPALAARLQAGARAAAPRFAWPRIAARVRAVYGELAC